MTADSTPSPAFSSSGRHPYGTVYLLHFDQRYEHAGHYTGWAEDLDRRLAEHLGGRAARLIEVITQAGIGFRLARTWPGVTRARERQLKRQGGASRYCPICQDDRKARGEQIELLTPRVSTAVFEENQQPSQHRVATITRRAVQARLQARQHRNAARAEQGRTRELAARTHQRLTSRQQPADRGAAGGRSHRTREERDRER